MNMTMGCGCLTYPCPHVQSVGLGQTHQSLYDHMLRQYAGAQNMNSIKPVINHEKEKTNKKLLLLRK